MSLYKTFGTDDNLENEGIFLEVEEGIRFKVRRMGGKNKKYSERMAKISRPYKRQLEQGTLEEHMAKSLLKKAFVDACLCGWEGVTDKENRPLVYSKENALKLFDDLPDLFDLLREEADKLINFQEEEKEDIIKK
jgi:hypothetical protein